MRQHTRTSVVVIAVLACAYSAPLTRAQAQTDAKAAAVIADVRKALGGDQKLAAMKTLSLRADYRRELTGGPGPGGGGMMFIMRGAGGGSAEASTQATGKMEIDVELPDKYLRCDIGASGFAMTRTDGFEGTRAFQEAVPNTPGMQIRIDNPADNPELAKMALRRSQQDLARLFLGLTGTTQPGFAATYAYGGQAESPDGKADILDVTGPEGFKVRLFVDAATHLPLMLTYMDAEPRVMTRTMNRGGGRGDAPAGGAPTTVQVTPEQRDELEKQMRAAQAEPPKMVEYRLFFADYRKIDGLSLPYQISRGTAAKTTEEWTVTSYKVNPTFKADRFKVGR